MVGLPVAYLEICKGGFHPQMGWGQVQGPLNTPLWLTVAIRGSESTILSPKSSAPLKIHFWLRLWRLGNAVVVGGRESSGSGMADGGAGKCRQPTVSRLVGRYG